MTVAPKNLNVSKMNIPPHIIVPSDNSDKLNFTCSVFHYLQAYFRIGFYLCILPFRVVIDEKGNLQFQQFKLHQLMCLILHISAIHFALTRLSDLQHVTPLFLHISANFFKIILIVILNIGITLQFINCWVRRCLPFKNVMEVAFKYRDKSCQFTFSKVANIAVCLTIITQMAVTANLEFVIFLEDLSLPTHISDFINVLCVMQSFYYFIVFHYAVILSLPLSCFSMFLIGERFRVLSHLVMIESQSQHNIESLMRLTDYFIEVESLTTALNRAFGNIITVVFLSMIPTVGFGVSTMFYSNVTTMAYVRTFYILIVSYTFALLGATGSHCVKAFARQIFEQMWRTGSLKQDNQQCNLLLTIMQYVNSSSVGVGGTPFFTFTYTFLGNMTSVLITYTIIMLQFREENKVSE